MGCAAAEEPKKCALTFIDFWEPIDVKFGPIAYVAGRKHRGWTPSIWDRDVRPSPARRYLRAVVVVEVVSSLTSSAPTRITGLLPGGESETWGAPPFQALRRFDHNLIQVGRLGVGLLEKHFGTTQETRTLQSWSDCTHRSSQKAD